MRFNSSLPVAAGLMAALVARRVGAQTSQPDVTPAGSAAAPGSQTAPGGASAAPPAAAATPSAPEGPVRTGTRASVTLAGYVEALYSYNFNEPSNGITNYRGFDSRHNTFTLSNVVLDATGTLDRVYARLALQVGTTAETSYLAEPDRPGGASTGGSNANVWRMLQQAYVGWRAPVGSGLLLEAGLFLSPIGPESMAVHDQWNWSRSNLFFGLPFYHTGARVTYALTDRASVTAAAYNGWNSVVDNNEEKSVSAQFTYTVPERVTFNVLYFGGIERAPGAPEGRAWRHLFDAYVVAYPTSAVSFMAHVDGGFEPNAFGTSAWAAGALYLRVRPVRWLYLVARGDIFYEHRASNAEGTAAAIAWPSAWVSSGTATVDVRPHDNVSIRLEYRHDQADGDTYYRGAVSIDPMSQTFAPNARSQDTVTLGTTAWF